MKRNNACTAVFDNIPDDHKIYALSVDAEMTYANSIYPGDYIDLYVQTTDDDGKVLFGALIESIEVLAVRDSESKDVFWDSEAGDTAFLLFSVPDDYHKLLNIAKLYGIDIIPVPRSASYTINPGETNIASETLYYYIKSKAANISD